MMEKKMKVDVGDGRDSSKNIEINLKGMVSYDKLRLIQDMIKGYLIAFQDRAEKFESEESQKIIETILDTFKFLDT